MEVKMQQEIFKKCCVPFCDIEMQNCGGKVQFYPFPSDLLLKQKWMNAIYLYGMKNTISVITPGSHFVCSRHFTKESSYRMPTVFWDEDGHCRIVNENMEAKENDVRKISHSEQVLYKLNEFRQNKKLVDITVNVSNVQFEAHKAVLSVTCPFFEELFQKYPTVLQANLSKASEEAFSALLTYFYSGELDVNVLNIHEIEHLAKILQVEKVLHICTQWRKKNSLLFLSESSILSGDHGYCKGELNDDLPPVSKQSTAKLESTKSFADKSVRQSKRIQEKIPLKKLRSKRIVDTKHVDKKTNSYDSDKKRKALSNRTKEKQNSKKKSVKQNKMKDVKQNKTINTKKHRPVGVKRYKRIGVKIYKTSGTRSNKRMPRKKTEKNGVKPSKTISIKKGKMIRVEPTNKKVKQVENLLPQHNFIIQSIQTKKVSPKTSITNPDTVSENIESITTDAKFIPVVASVKISDAIQNKPDGEKINTTDLHVVTPVSQNIQSTLIDCKKSVVTDIDIANETKNVPTTESDKFYICTECGWKESSHDSMKKHLTSVHKKMSILSLRPFTSDFLNSVKVKLSNSRLYQIKLKQRKEAAQKSGNIRTGSQESLPILHCHLCEFKITSNARLQRHKLEVHFSKDILHECDICSKSFPTQFRLDKHLKEHLYPPYFGCGHCDYKSNMTAKLRHHIRIYHDGYPFSFQCIICPFKCANSFSFLHHIKKEHEYQPPKRKRNPDKNDSKKIGEKKSEENKNPDDISSDTQQLSRLFGCGYCDYIGPTSFRIKHHISSVHKDKSCLFKCVSCPFQDENSFTFLQHLKTEHNCCLPKRSSIMYKISSHETNTDEKKNVEIYEMNTKNMLLRMFGCGYCDYMASTAFRIRCHIKSIHNEDPCLFKCLICPFQEENSLSFLQHLRSEHNYLSFQTNTFTNSIAFNKGSEITANPKKDSSADSQKLDKFESKTNSNTESLIQVPDNLTECNISSINPSPDSLSEVNKDLIDYKCRFCPKILKSHWARQKHILLKHATMAHHCPYCSYIGQKASIIRIHVRRVHNKDVFIKCPLCSFKVNSLPEFRWHMKKEHEVQPTVPEHKEAPLISDAETDAEELSKENMSCQSMAYQCTICEKTYNIYRSLLTHKRKHFNSEQFGCPYCNFTTLKADEMRFHVKNIHNENPALKCNWCNFCCNGVHKIREHVVAEHKQEAFPSKKQTAATPTDDIHKLCAMVKSNVDSYKCDHCDGTFSNKKTYNIHSSEHSAIKKFSCPYCDFSTATIDSIRLHIKFKHNRKTIYKCAACSYENTNFSEFRSHMYSEHREDFKYDAAKEPSKTQDHLVPKSSDVQSKKPSKTISSTKAVSSAKKISSKKLTSLLYSKEKILSKLRVVKSGTSIKPCGYSCVHCQHFEMLEDDMKTHIKKSHQGFAIYKCNDIEMPITSRTDDNVIKDSESAPVDSESTVLEIPENLKRNVSREKQHLMEPFCDVCHERFENWIKLKIHVYESNHLSKCSECEYTTKDKSQLFYHQKNVHKLPLPSFLTTSSYRCPLCPFEIHKLSFARYHMKIAHSKISNSVSLSKDSDPAHKEIGVQKNFEEPYLETQDVNENEPLLSIDNVDHSTENVNGDDAVDSLEDVQDDEVDNDDNGDILERQVINADYWNYICYSCGEFTTDEIEMRQHIVNIHNKKNTYIVASALILVKKKETAIYRNKKLSNFVCCSCQYTKADDTEVRQHIKDEHNGMSAYQVRPQGRQYNCTNKRIYNNICFKCQQEFPNMTERDNHIRIMNHQLFCGKCDYSTKSPQWYHFHKCYRHNIPLPKDLEYEAFRCPYCPFISERSTVEKHIKVSHNLEYEHFCKLCPSRFKARRKLREHLTEHIPEKYKFGCPDCGHQGVSHHAILKHLQQIHLKNNLKTCPHCSYTAITSSVLNRHLAIHLAPPTMNIKRSMKDKLASEEPKKKVAKLKLQVDTINLPFINEPDNCETIITSNDEPGNDVVVTVITISNDMQNAENLNTTLVENNIDATEEIIDASSSMVSIQNNLTSSSLSISDNYLESEMEEPSNAIHNEAIVNSEDSLHYICFACGHHSLLENDLKQHITNVHENIAIYVISKEFQIFTAMPATCDGYICHSCNHIEKSLMEIKSHIKNIHEGVALYRLHPKQETSLDKANDGHMCWTCNNTFFTRLQLRDHVRQSKHRIQCDLCPWSTVGINYNLLQIHKNIKHHVPLPEDQIHLLYKCPHCTFEHYNEYCSLKHVQKCYSHENAFWCKSCHLGFATYKKLLCHLANHINEGNWFYCSACTHKSLLSQEVFRHIKSSHCVSEIQSERTQSPSPILSQEKASENQLIRDEINNSINKFKVLNSKSEQLPQNDIYTCCNCDYHTTEAISMREHSKNAHEGLSLFERAPVRNSYSSSVQLECMECKEKFTHENLLHTHMIVFNHPAKCNMCPYKTMSLKFLMIHKENKHKISRNMAGTSTTKKLPRKRIYIRASSYLCDLCGRTFSNSALLNWHQQTHPLLKEGPMKKQKNLQCPHCKRKCFDQLELNTHIEQRHQLKLEPEFCPICSKVCTSRPRLRAHMLKRHKMGVKAHRRLQLQLSNTNKQTSVNPVIIEDSECSFEIEESTQ